MGLEERATPHIGEPTRIPSSASDAEEQRFCESHDSTDHADPGRARAAAQPPTLHHVDFPSPAGEPARAIRIAAHEARRSLPSLIKTWLAEKVDSS